VAARFTWPKALLELVSDHRPLAERSAAFRTPDIGVVRENAFIVKAGDPQEKHEKVVMMRSPRDSPSSAPRVCEGSSTAFTAAAPGLGTELTER
jgi:hypothetical protein